MFIDLKTAVFYAGLGQLCVLMASSLVPIRLGWRETFAALPRLDRQLFWVYGGYVVMSIISLGLICIFNADELAAGSRLGRCFCAYATVFWGIRLSLQPFLAAKPFLTTWCLRCGYHLLTVLFSSFTIIFAWAVVH